jgi:hypothetical protein
MQFFKKILYTLILLVFLKSNTIAKEKNEEIIKDTTCTNSAPNLGHLQKKTFDIKSKNGKYFNALKNIFRGTAHFQGIYKLPSTNYLLITFADFKNNRSELIWLTSDNITNSYQYLKRTFLSINSIHWHAGALGGIDNWVSIPMENVGKKNLEKGIIQIYDFKDPLRPVLATEISTETHQTMATDIIKIANDRYLLASLKYTGIEFYLSKSSNLHDGFDEEAHFISKKNIINFPQHRKKLKGQSLQFYQKCDGEIFLAEFDNNSPIAPYISGKNQIYWYSLNLNLMRDDHIKDNNLLLSYHSKDTIPCRFDCQFDAGSSISIENNQLTIYSINHFYSFLNKKIKFSKFSIITQ